MKGIIRTARFRRSGWTALASTGVGVTVFATRVAMAAQNQTSPFGNPVWTVLKLLLSLVLIVVLVVLLVRFLARRTQVEQRGGIRVLAARQVAPNKSVQVIDVEGRKYLLGVGDDVTLLADITADYPEADGVVEAEPGFGALLASSLQSLRARHRSRDQSEENQE